MILTPDSNMSLHRKYPQILPNIDVDLSSAKLTLEGYQMLEVEYLTLGLYRPLTGFPDYDDIHAVMENWELASGEFMPMLPLLSVSEQDYQSIPEAGKISLIFEGKIVGELDVTSKFKFDVNEYIQAIYPQVDVNHKGIQHLSRHSSWMISGVPSLYEGSLHFFGGGLRILPHQIREWLSAHSWSASPVFSTTNAPHRAHEYLQRTILEVFGSLVIQPLEVIDGYAKLPFEAVSRSYRYMVNHIYPHDRVLLCSLPSIPRSAGPRSTMLQALIRSNFGFTHQLVGRDHEGYGDFFGLYDSQNIFDLHGHRVDLTPICLEGPFYCTICDGCATEKTCAHPSHRQELSGSLIRDYISRQELPPSYLIRPEIARYLQETS